jgi:hypothetical protein
VVIFGEIAESFLYVRVLPYSGMADERQLDIEPGDFLYQVDQELFLVLMEERDDEYLFSVHGWREIDKDRAAGYVKGEQGKLHSQDKFESVVEERADDETTESYEKMKALFEKYSDDFDTEGPVETFSMEDQ